jgi:hypothetical protein
MYRLIIFLLFMVFNSTYAATMLFGMDLHQATRGDMRTAVRNSGAKLIKEAGSDGFFDEYGSDKLLKGSSRLYLGYVKKDNRLAFVEYQLDGLHHPEIIQKLTRKYGKPETVKGKFYSDSRHQWLSDGVKILMYQDWAFYKTRLLYFLPKNLSDLRLEYQQFQASSSSAQITDSDQVY